MERTYICIDLKSFYASVECRERNLNALTTNLVVADKTRTEKTICLAVSPSLKSYGISGRARLFEVIQKVREINSDRKKYADNHEFKGCSYDSLVLEKDRNMALTYIAAPPRMSLYMKYSTFIYNIYLKYIAPEDIHVYSIDEVFIDVTNYINTYKTSARKLAEKMINDVLLQTGITATAGIGTNLYLAKIAMDIGAKHIEPDKNGVRISELDVEKYRRLLWNHRPLTDFWRVGKGYAKKLEQHGIYTMGDIALCSLGKPYERYNEDLLFKLFGVNAELLIDHAWGYEPCTIKEIKEYKPETNSISSGQVLECPYDFEKTRLVVLEMIDSLVLDLVEKKLVTDRIVLTIGYDIENLTVPERKKKYKGEIITDSYGRKVPKYAHGTANIGKFTSSSKTISTFTMSLFDKIIDKNLLVRRINVTAGKVINESALKKEESSPKQLDFFTDYEECESASKLEKEFLKKERDLQETIIGLKKQFGKNAVIKGMNMKKGATAIDRNGRIGGHKK